MAIAALKMWYYVYYSTTVRNICAYFCDVLYTMQVLPTAVPFLVQLFSICVHSQRHRLKRRQVVLQQLWVRLRQEDEDEGGEGRACDWRTASATTATAYGQKKVLQHSYGNTIELGIQMFGQKSERKTLKVT